MESKTGVFIGHRSKRPPKKDAMTAEQYKAEEASLRVKVGAVIRQHREEHGETATAFAKACGISTSHLREIEKGRTDPTLKILTAIAHHMGMSTADLFQLAE